MPIAGNNTGWILACRGGGRWKWNFKGKDRGRFDFNGGKINDNKWHHIAVSHNRAGYANFYQDGEFLGRVDISNAGILDPGIGMAIGQDGTYNYGAHLNGSVDEVSIIQRTMSDAQIKGYYEMGRP